MTFIYFFFWRVLIISDVRETSHQVRAFRTSCSPARLLSPNSQTWDLRVRESCAAEGAHLSPVWGELESWSGLIADSGNPLLLSLLHPDELWQRGHLQLQAFLSSKCASRFFLFFFFVGRRDGRKAQGYLWSNHYTISSPQRPCCIHLSVGSPLSCSISPCHSPPLSPTRSLLLSFPIYLSSNLRLLCFSLYSVPQPDAL